jgi:hypothetical protein
LRLAVDEWKLFGKIYISEPLGIKRVRVIAFNNIYDMQFDYLEPILRKFSVRINNRFNPDFDYLSRFEEMERLMKLEFNSTIERELSDENEKLIAKITSLNEELEIMRKAIDDIKIIKEPVIFCGV